MEDKQVNLADKTSMQRLPSDFPAHEIKAETDEEAQKVFAELLGAEVLTEEAMRKNSKLGL
ncbi:MAG: hypothetical protein KW793_03515 [Candidatus Doudnabacteria bacterium]|nr:hypothetical protein [Candidatus Doudnabacteria bacterium]